LALDLWWLPNLKIFACHSNYLTGAISKNLFNISSLQEIALANNSLYGNLPSDYGFSCPNLENLLFA
jgi:hypothetical protein